LSGGGGGCDPGAHPRGRRGGGPPPPISFPPLWGAGPFITGYYYVRDGTATLRDLRDGAQETLARAAAIAKLKAAR
ncbi:MAG: hypothetical protein AAF684_09495, partial [Pseudomonadota bacterium]